MPMVQVPYGHTSITRYAPEAGPQHFMTYEWSAPLRSHWRKATCEEYECDDFINGFVLTVDLSTELGKKQYYFVTKVDRERSYSMQRVTQTMVKFIYGPGNPCFAPKRNTHRVPIGRPPFYIVAQGDWRGNPRGTPRYLHRRAEDWIDDSANHFNRLAEAAKRG